MTPTESSTPHVRGRLRRRLLGLHRPCAMDRWIHGLAMLGALIATAVLVPVLVVTYQWIALGGLALAWLAPVFARMGPFGSELESAARLLAIGACLISGVPSLLYFPVLTAALAISASQSSTSDDAAAASFVLSALSVGGMAAAADEGALLLLPIPALCLAITGLLWIQARAAYRRVRDGSGAQPEESVAGLRGRALLGSGLALLLLLLLPLSFQTAERAQIVASRWLGIETGMGDLGPEQGAVDPGAAEDEERGREEGSGSMDRRPDGAGGEPGEATGEPRVVRSFPDSLGFHGLSRMVRGEQSKRLELRVLQPRIERRRFDEGRPAYLLITTYDGFAADGLRPARHDPLREFTDGGDGRRDDWAQVVPDPQQGTFLELQVVVSALRAPNTRPPRLTIPRLEPVVAAKRAELQHRASGMLTVPDDGAPLQEFTFRTRQPFVDVLGLRRPVFDRSDDRFLRLPRPGAWDPVVGALRAQLEELDAGEEPLRAVLAHFKRGYAYSLADPEPGLEGLAGFLEERRGYCTYFATSAMLMLRLLDVPARVAAGYRVTRWDTERQAYVAGDQAAHAWVEVRLAGKGWVPIDPTPAIALAEAVAMRTEQLEQLEAEERAERAGEEAAAAEQALAEEAAALDPNNPDADPAAEGAGAAANTDDATPGEGGEPATPALPQVPMPDSKLLLLGLLALVAILARALFTSKRPDAEDEAASAEEEVTAWTEDDPAMQASPDFRRVIELFQQLGFRLGGRLTPLEFSRETIAERGTSYQPMLRITSMLYGWRYGGRDMGGAAWAEFERFEAAVERALSRD